MNPPKSIARTKNLCGPNDGNQSASGCPSTCSGHSVTFIENGDQDDVSSTAYENPATSAPLGPGLAVQRNLSPCPANTSRSSGGSPEIHAPAMLEMSVILGPSWSLATVNVRKLEFGSMTCSLAPALSIARTAK